MAGDEISLGDEVRRADRQFTETQMGYGDAAGLLGVVGKISLGVHVGVVTDNLDGALVGADRTITAEAPEFAVDRTGRCRVKGHAIRRKRGVCHVIDDADRKPVHRRILSDVFKDSGNISRREVF